MCPPGVDQTTRTPQGWQFIAPRVQRRAQLAARYSPNYWESHVPRSVIFTPENEWNAWDKLIVPPSAEQGPFRVHLETAVDKRRKPLSKLEALPLEILDHVLSYLSAEPCVVEKDACEPNKANDLGEASRRDVLSLGLSSTSLWISCLWHISHLSQPSQSWAGAEIACTGTWLTFLPPSFEEAGLAPPGTADRQALRAPMYGMCGARRFNWGTWSYAEDERKSPMVLWMESLDGILDAGEAEYVKGVETVTPGRRKRKRESKHAVNGDLRKMLRDATDVSAGIEGNSGKTGEWRLRNLSKEVFVKVVPPKLEEGKYIGAQIQTQTPLSRRTRWLRKSTAEQWTPMLDDALLLNISWSDHIERQTAPWEGNGKWAGDKFDIVFRFDGVDDVPGEECWKDVTEELVTEMAVLRKSVLSQRNSKHGITIFRL